MSVVKASGQVVKPASKIPAPCIEAPIAVKCVRLEEPEIADRANALCISGGQLRDAAISAIASMLRKSLPVALDASATISVQIPINGIIGLLTYYIICQDSLQPPSHHISEINDKLNIATIIIKNQVPADRQLVIVWI